MSEQPTSIDYGFRGRWNWLISGAIGGVAGSWIFGAVLWMIDPEIVAVAIPGLYGLAPAGGSGWTLHTVHGLVLGIVFGFLITREPVINALITDVAIDFLASVGPGTRFTLAGMLYGLAVWAIVPVLMMPIWVAVTGTAEPVFPAVTVESLVGHLVFGLILGSIFSVFVRITPEAEEAES